MTDRLGRMTRVIVITLAAGLGMSPPVWAQQCDVDRVLRRALADWKEGTPASRERALDRWGVLDNEAAPAVPWLIEALQSPSPIIRVQAAGILRAMAPEGKEGIPALTALLADPEFPVRQFAALALASFGREAAPAVPALVKSLRAEHERSYPAAVVALVSIGQPALPVLVELLRDPDPSIRRAALDGVWHAVRTSAPMKDERALGVVLERELQPLARDNNPDVRIALAEMLIERKTPSPSALRTLEALSRDRDDRVRSALAKAVAGSLLPHALYRPLLARRDDRDRELRTAAFASIPPTDLVRPDVIAWLIEGLQDPHPEVRAAAAGRLLVARQVEHASGNRGWLSVNKTTSPALTAHPAAGRILLASLNDSNPAVRAAAAHLLPAFPALAAAAIPRLTERLKDPVIDVRAEAAAALAELGPPARIATRTLLAIVANPDDGSPSGRQASDNAALALEAMGGDARAKMFRLLLGQYNALDDDVRQRAQWIMRTRGPWVVDELLHALAHERTQPQVNREIVTALFELVKRRWTPSQSCLAHESFRPAMMAAVPAIRVMVWEEEGEEQAMALALLAVAEPANPEAPALYRERARTCADPDLDECWSTLILQPEMIPALAEGLEDADVPVRIALVRALADLVARLQEEALRHEPAGPVLTARRARSAELKTCAARALLNALEDPDNRIRWIAAQALGTARAEETTVIPALIAMARTAAARVPADDVDLFSFRGQGQWFLLAEKQQNGDPLRVAAIQGLAQFGPAASAAVPELTRALEDRDPRIRWFAAEALGQIGPAAAPGVPALIAVLRSADVVADGLQDVDDAQGDAPIRLIATVALGQIGPGAAAAVPELAAALSGPDSRVRAEAARSLGLIGPKAAAATSALLMAAGHSRNHALVENTTEALPRLGPAAIPALTAGLGHDDPAIRAAAVRLMGEIGQESPLPFLAMLRRLRDRDARVRAAAAPAMARVCRRSLALGLAVAPFVVPLLSDPDDDVAEAARSALLELGVSCLPAHVAGCIGAISEWAEPSSALVPVRCVF